MPLVSSGGGALRTPKYLPGHAPSSLGYKPPKPMKPLKYLPGHAPSSLGFKVGQKTPKPPTVKVIKPKTPSVPGVVGPDPNDPMAFVQSLMTSTDPAAARTLIDSVYAPVRDEYNQQIAQLQGVSAAQAKQMTDVYTAFAQYMTGMPAQIQSIYGQKGASDAGALMSGPVGGVNAKLQGMQDIQNASLDAQGKNWAAYAAAQPHIYALQATASIKQMLGVEQANETQIRMKLLDLSSKEASDILSYLEQAQAKDAQLAQWGFQQKQANQNALINQSQAKLNYDLKVQVDAENQMNIALSRGDKLSAEKWKETYQNSSLQVRRDQIDASNARAAASQAGQNTRSQNAIDAANARQATSIAAAATAKTNTQTAAKLKAANTGLAKAKHDANILAGKLAGKTAPGGVSTSRNIYKKDKNGKVVVDSKGKPIVIGHTTVRTGGGNINDRKTVWNRVYKAYASTMFNYYRTLYPGMAKTPGALQTIVEKAIDGAVGWGKNG